VVTSFTNAELGAPPDLLANDAAELLVSTAARVGPGPAVDAMVDVLGRDAAVEVLPRLQPLALTGPTRREAKTDDLLKKVTEQLRERTDVEQVKLAEIERLSPRTLVLIVLGAVAIYLLAPQLAGASDIWSKVRHANPAWFVAALGASATTFLGAAMGIEGSVAATLPYWSNVTTQLAAAFAGFATPAQLGGMALNTRFMQRNGVDSPVAVAAVGLNAISAVLVHFALLVAFAVWSGSNGFGSLHLPGRTLLIIGIVVVISAAIFGALPFGRKLGDRGDHRQPDRLGLRRAGHGRGRVHRHRRLRLSHRRGRLLGRPHPRRPGRGRGHLGGRPARCRYGQFVGPRRRAVVPAGHLLAAHRSGVRRLPPSAEGRADLNVGTGLASARD
jgi:undecaprenyl-diphosphatase